MALLSQISVVGSRAHKVSDMLRSLVMSVPWRTVCRVRAVGRRAAGLACNLIIS